MGQIEEAGPLPDCPVLVEDPAVLERHEPPAELDQLGAQRTVSLYERRFVQLVVDEAGHFSLGRLPVGRR